jgi:predicted site-specific integrase-resolvase|tara:strand:+ start:1658 stop:1987 length:330 start_codon:yes stop_codon:yes gene_type:complete
MSWKSNLEQEYYKETNIEAYYDGSEQYNYKYVEWLEEKLAKSESHKQMLCKRVSSKLIKQGIADTVKQTNSNEFRINNISEEAQKGILDAGFQPVSLNWSQGGYLLFKA